MERITINPKICGGMACIRGMRMPVVTVLKVLASGIPQEEILRDCPELEKDDILACLDYAAWLSLIWLWERRELLLSLVERLKTLPLPAPCVGREFPFADAPVALEWLRSGRSIGKVVLTEVQGNF
jgi:uncharacterized protein (DUF433 family)